MNPAKPKPRQTVAETNMDSFELWTSPLDFAMTNMSGFP